MTENELSRIIIGYAIDIHSTLGAGLLESVYQECLYYKLKEEGFKVEKEKPIGIKFENLTIPKAYYIDLLVENKLVIELKSVQQLGDNHFAQTLTYLRLGKYKLALLINFREAYLKDGIRRVINGKLN